MIFTVTVAPNQLNLKPLKSLRFYDLLDYFVKTSIIVYRK